MQASRRKLKWRQSFKFVPGGTWNVLLPLPLPIPLSGTRPSHVPSEEVEVKCKGSNVLAAHQGGMWDVSWIHPRSKVKCKLHIWTPASVQICTRQKGRHLKHPRVESPTFCFSNGFTDFELSELKCIGLAMPSISERVAFYDQASDRVEWQGQDTFHTGSTKVSLIWRLVRRVVVAIFSAGIWQCGGIIIRSERQNEGFAWF